MENSKFGQEIKMSPMEPKAVKDSKTTVDGINVLQAANVKFIYRDLAITWPSSDPNAENVDVFQDYLSLLMSEGWRIEEAQIYERKPIGDMTNEFVIPVFFLLVR
jgi:hypothetical protein